MATASKVQLEAMYMWLVRAGFIREDESVGRVILDFQFDNILKVYVEKPGSGLILKLNVPSTISWERVGPPEVEVDVADAIESVGGEPAAPRKETLSALENKARLRAKAANAPRKGKK